MAPSPILKWQLGQKVDLTVSEPVSVGLESSADVAVRAALNKVLSSTTFAQVERLKRFLEFICTETLSGRSSQLKEYLVGAEVFAKPVSFDPRNDPIVRVQARRLRAKLASYYAEEGREDSLWIELPKGSYVPVFNRHGKTIRQRPVIGLPVSENSVAILPFADHSQGGELEYFCLGLSEEILSSLIRVESLRVVPWTHARKREQGMAGILEAADELRVGTVIDGSVRKMGERLRVHVHSWMP